MVSDIVIPLDTCDNGQAQTIYQDIVSCITPKDIISFNYNGIIFNVYITDGISSLQQDIANALRHSGFYGDEIKASILNNDLALIANVGVIKGVIFGDLDVIKPNCRYDR